MRDGGLRDYIDSYIVRSDDKPLVWMGSSLEDVRRFPAVARKVTGYALRRVQRGLMPTNWRPMSGVGPGVVELRVSGVMEYRVLYLARFAEAVYVLHAFAKRSRKTSRADIDLTRERLGAVQRIRRGRGG